MNGIIVIDKPKGKSSNQVVGIVKHFFNQKKVGHLGTLDPMATGVLPVCLGKATKLFDMFLSKSKTYLAQFTFGKTTDTLDSEGVVLDKCDNIPSRKEIELVLQNLIGIQDQIPPKYSAKSVNGVRAYELSRKGVEFELKPKQIEVFDFRLTKQISTDTFEFLIDCSSGTYIRSLARDLGLKCNSLAYMSALKRVRAGQFTIDCAVTLENMTHSDVVPLEKVLQKFEKVVVSDEFYNKLKNGNSIKIKSEDKTNLLVYCKHNLFGIGECKNNILKVTTNLFDAQEEE